MRELAPDGGGRGVRSPRLASARISYSVLARGGRLLSYGTASALDGSRSVVALFIALMSRLLWWNALPDDPRAVSTASGQATGRVPQRFVAGSART